MMLAGLIFACSCAAAVGFGLIAAQAQIGLGNLPLTAGAPAASYKAMLFGEDSNTGATYPRYISPGGSFLITAQAQAQFEVPYAGTISHFDAHFGGTGTSNVYTVTMYDGGTTIGTCTVTYPSVACDTPWSGAYSAAQGDLISWKIAESGGTAHAPYLSITAEIDSVSPQGIWESGTGAGTMYNSATRYFGMITFNIGVEANARLALPTGGTLRNFGAVLYGLTGGTYTMGGRYNATATWGSCTVSAAVCQDTSGTQAFSAGDYYSNLQAPSSATGTVSANTSGEVDFTGGGTMPAGGSGGNSIAAASAPWYIGLGRATSATETQAEWPVPFSGNLKNVEVFIYTGPGSSAGWTFTVNYDGSSSGSSCTISNTTSTFQTCLIAGPIAVTQDHLIDIAASVQSGTPSSTQVYWAAELQ